ncbi:MAG: BMP family ABC transporter substrate-binding protein [Anaerolineae bacterium]|nr:BMP family ABC transporter substrate-binding protein [Anaerolineae bacterium]NUQ06229.1 BMP family ABC transporter substrate-binding protein [Anaerolineae bacterium]
MFRTLGFLSILSILFTLLFSAAVLPLQAQTAVESVCLITDIGKINDGTFNQFAYEGMARAAEAFDLNSTFIETQALTDYDANIAVCVEEGYDLIITVGWRLTDATYAAAAANPDHFFVGVDAFFVDPLPNLVGIQAREDQAGFIVGALAALMTESGIVGGIYGIAEPPVMRFRNGYEQGVRYTNPEVQVLGVYIDDYVAPDRGAAAAEQFIGEGADVLFGAGGETGSGGILRGAQMGVRVIGVDQDEYNTTFGGGETPGAEYLISSALKRVDNGVYLMIEAAVNGSPFPSDSIFTLMVENEGIDFAPPHDADVPETVTEQVRAVLEGLRGGSIETGVDPVSGNLLSEVSDPAATPEASG